MSGSNRIRWSESDLNELRRIAKNHNAKVSRQQRKLVNEGKVFEAANLPQKVSVRELRKTITTRKDFKNQLKVMQNFIDTGNKYVIDGNLKKSLHATVRDFNSELLKIRSQIKDRSLRAALPEKLTIEDVIKEATTPEKLKRDLQSYQRFFKDKSSQQFLEIPDTKYNIKITKWQADLFEERKKEIDIMRQTEKHKYLETEVKYMGKSAGYKQRRYNEEKYNDEFSDLNLYNFSMKYTDMRAKMRVIMRESNEDYYAARTQLARLNYLEKMDKLIGNMPIGKMIMKKVNSLSLGDFYRELKGDDDMFLLLYDLEKNPDNMDTIMEMIFNEWFPDKDMYEELNNMADRTGVH